MFMRIRGSSIEGGGVRGKRPGIEARRDVRWPALAGVTRSTAIVLALLLLACVRPVRGQRITLGPRLGLTVSTVRFQDPNANDQTEMRLGFHVGVAAAVRLRGSLETEASLLLVQGGFGGRGGHPASLRTMGIEVPVIFRVRAPWRVSPHVLGGFAVRVQVGCRLSDVGIIGQTGCADPVVGSDWKRLGIAGVVGAGAGLGLGPGVMLFEGTVHWGLSDIKADDLPPGWARSADVRLSTVYRFPVR